MAKWQKTSSGAPLSIPAASWNALMDMGAEWDRRREQGSPALSAERPGACLVKNSSGAARAAFSVLAVTGSLIAPADNLDEFKRLPAVVAGNPTAVSRTLVVIQRQARVDEIVDGLLCGSSICQVNVGKEDHGYAVPAAGGIPASAAAGPLRILWKAAGTGNVWALVSWPASPKTAVTIGTSATNDFVTDGTADDVQWQAAIDLAAALGAPIVAAAGTYTMAAALTAPAGCRLSIRSASTSRVVFQPASALAYCLDASSADLDLRHITIQANGSNKFGIGIAAARLCMLTCNVNDTTGSGGIYVAHGYAILSGVAGTGNAIGVNIYRGFLSAHRCTFSSGGTGIDTTESTALLASCTASSNTGSGISCNGPSIVSGCSASSNGENGIVATIGVGSGGTGNGSGWGGPGSRYDINMILAMGCSGGTRNVAFDGDLSIYAGSQAFVTAVDFGAETVTTKTLAAAAGSLGRITSIT
jgi:hypothetical protein